MGNVYYWFANVRLTYNNKCISNNTNIFNFTIHTHKITTPTVSSHNVHDTISSNSIVNGSLKHPDPETSKPTVIPTLYNSKSNPSTLVTTLSASKETGQTLSSSSITSGITHQPTTINTIAENPTQEPVNSSFTSITDDNDMNMSINSYKTVALITQPSATTVGSINDNHTNWPYDIIFIGNRFDYNIEHK